MSRVVLSSVVFVATIGACAVHTRGCPPVDGYVARSTTGNYAVVYDRQVVMETQLSAPTEDLDDHVQNSSLAVHNEHNEALVAFESDRSPTNGMYVVRYDYNGFPICSTSPADDFPVRMDNPSPAGLHKHVSISMRKAHTLYLGFDSDKKFFGNWVATPVSPGGSKSRMMQFAAPKEAMPTAAFSDANFGQIAIGGSDTEDIAPSSAMSGASGLGWESDFSNDLRANSGTNQRGLLRLINSAATGALLRCCDGPTSDPCEDEICSVQYQIYMIASIDRDNADTEHKFINEPNRDVSLATGEHSPVRNASTA